jgi:hypothetical protein
MRKITWTAGHPTFTGSIGPVELFRCMWLESAVYPDKPWSMRTTLPGHAGQSCRGETPADLREQAAGILASHLALLTGSDEDEGLDDEPRPRLTDGHIHQNGAHPGWLGHDGHPVHRHQMSTGRTEWEKP